MRAPYSRTLYDLLCERAQARADAIAAATRETSITYAALLARTRAVAGALANRGLRRGDRVGAVLGNRIEWLELAFACSAIGATFAPFSTWSTRSELEFLLADSEVALLVAYAAYGDRAFADDLASLAPELIRGEACPSFPKLREIVTIGQGASTPFPDYEDFVTRGAGFAERPPGEAASPADDALILYTSGSSAFPKAVRLQNFGVIENGFNIGERMGLGADDRVLLSAPLFWSYGSANALAATMTHGATLVLQERFEAGGVLDLIEAHTCTAIYTLPGMTKALVNHPAFAPDRVQSLRTGLTIGSPNDFLFAVKSLGAEKLCNIYGATETYGNCCVTSSEWAVETRAQCQGAPLPGNDLRIVDPETGEPVAQGEPGLVEVRGYVMRGYGGASASLNADALTADGFYRTGDIGRLDERGAFVFIGRNTEMIKRAGINVSPAEVENILLAHPAVSQAAVVGAPDAELGERIVAFIIPADPAARAEDLIAHCRAVASKYKAPDRIVFQDALPFTPTGKLQRRALKQAAEDVVIEPSRKTHAS